MRLRAPFTNKNTITTEKYILLNITHNYDKRIVVEDGETTPITIRAGWTR